MTNVKAFIIIIQYKKSCIFTCRHMRRNVVLLKHISKKRKECSINEREKSNGVRKKMEVIVYSYKKLLF